MGIRERLAKALSLPTGTVTQTEAQIAASGTPQSGMLATPLPREPELAYVPFPPATPLNPALINAPRKDGRAEPRKYEFPVAWNIQIVEQRNIPFRVLREVADGADIIRKCIEVNKAALAGMAWDISINEDAIARVMAEQGIGNTKAAQLVREKYQAEITMAKDFWRMPDRMNGMSFQEWLMMALEEVLVIDALSIYPNKTLDNKSLHSLEIIDGTTIKPLLNAHGSRPIAPHPAFQQILWGFPRGEFTASPDADGEFTADDLVYVPRTRRTWTPYGLSPTERCLPLVDLYMKRLHWFRTEFTDGVMPDLIMKTDIDFGNNPSLITGYEQVFNDALAGNLEQRRRMRIVPNGFDPVQLGVSDAKYSSDFDDWLIKSICGHFGVLPTQIGFTPKSGLGGKGHQDGESNSAETLGLRPLIMWVQDLLNQLSHRFLNMPRDLTFVFSDGTQDDEMAQASRRQLETFSGQKTWNEVRTEMGLPLFTFPEADAPIIISGATVMPLSSAFEGVGVDAETQDDGGVDDAEGLISGKALELSKFIKWAKTEKQRPFNFEHVDDEHKELLNELVKTDAEAARDVADTLRKAGGVRPKVRTGTGEPFPKNHPARIKAQELTAIYTKKFSLLGNVDAESLAQRWVSSGHTDPQLFLREQNVKPLKASAVDVLKDLYYEAGWMGTAASNVIIARARRQVKAPSGGADWKDWKAGNSDKARILIGEDGKGSGFRNLLERANITMRDIEGTRLRMIGQVLAMGSERGSSITEIAGAINDVLEDKARSEIIAHTEMTRANTAAQMDNYKTNGVSEVEWQTADDNACEDCAAMADNSPYPITDIPEEPPFHPYCGCQLIPVAFDAEDEFAYTPDELAEMDAMEPIEIGGDDPNVEPAEPEVHSDIASEPEMVTESEVVVDRAGKDGWVEGKWEKGDVDAYKQNLRSEWFIKNPEPPIYQGQPQLNKYRQDKWQKALDKFDKSLKNVTSIHRNGENTIIDQFKLKPHQIEMAIKDFDLARRVNEPAGTGGVTVRLMKDDEFNRSMKGVRDAAGYCVTVQKRDMGEDITKPYMAVRGRTYKEEGTIREYYAKNGMSQERITQYVEPFYSVNIDQIRYGEYIMIHEYGHATDAAKLDTSYAGAKSQKLFEETKGSRISGYADTNKMEAYAESFTHWTHSKGETTDPTVLKYAETFNWRKP